MGVISFFDPCSLPGWAWVVNLLIVGFAAGAIIYWSFLWKGKDKSAQRKEEGDEEFRHRQDLGARAVETQLNAGLTSSSILLAAVFVLLGLSRATEYPLPTAASTQAVLGAIWLVISILLGVWNSGIMTSKVTGTDVSGSPSINIMLVAQLFFIACGGLSLLAALFLIK